MQVIIDQVGPSYKKKNRKKASFVIVNSDKYGGHHIHNIISALKSTGLVEQDARFRSKHTSDIVVGNCIIVGDCNTTFNYDYRTLKKKHTKQLEELDGRIFKVYDAVEGYQKIMKKIDQYARENNLGEYKSRNRYMPAFCCKNRNRKVQEQLLECPKIIIRDNVTTPTCPYYAQQQCPVQVPTCPILAPKFKSSYRRVDAIDPKQKITFFDNFIKIGFNQFDVEDDCLGNRFITDGAQNKYYINEDRYGRRLLVTK